MDLPKILVLVCGGSGRAVHVDTVGRGLIRLVVEELEVEGEHIDRDEVLTRVVLQV